MTRNVVNLARVREERKLSLYREKMARALAANKAAFDRLQASGKLFSREGARVGRELLGAHEDLLQVTALLEHLADEGVVPAPRTPNGVNAVYARLDALLASAVQVQAMA